MVQSAAIIPYAVSAQIFTFAGPDSAVVMAEARVQQDLRCTAVTRLAIAGCNEAEIATITGHSMKDVGGILDAHDLHCDSKLAESAIQKLEQSAETPN